MWEQIAAEISQATGEPFNISQNRSVGGGCINQSSTLSDGERTFFIKLNQASALDMFIAEAVGVKEMWETHTIRVPKPICWGTAGNSAYLVMEYLDLQGRGGGSGVWQEMGRKLAQMHRTGTRDRFGWDRSNTIGATPQMNPWTEDWAEFFAEHRIGFQLRLAARKGMRFTGADELVEKIPQLLAGHTPIASIVHGDLWGGNASVTAEGEPVIFDPATYYGDREVDIAMTELFGGFSAAFYQGYNEEWPLDEGYDRRKTLYNLYHIINHYNLFGGGYGSQAQSMIRSLLR
ncbi:fructosamine kinase family protein [Geitlerinema sp. P-1104]|uniref:fructosamine kinase family protein n=1 Tax=Geitlerinema sp. P-1104 TaxID=2546230 RepID=UPI001476FE1A|nr:fructosamine kinase family protein [Geitlerinema sp. P-1104]NMG57113.1 fructosamine kinase family protein [Geitlerinema sp. P-1104]